jgi:hypothetical protein
MVFVHDVSLDTQRLTAGPVDLVWTAPLVENSQHMLKPGKGW